MILQFYIKSNVSIGMIISVLHKGFTLSKNANTIQFGKKNRYISPYIIIDMIYSIKSFYEDKECNINMKWCVQNIQSCFLRDLTSNKDHPFSQIYKNVFNISNLFPPKGKLRRSGRRKDS